MKQKLQTLFITLLITLLGGVNFVQANAASVSIPQETGSFISLDDAKTSGALTLVSCKVDGKGDGQILGSIKNGYSATLALSNSETQDMVLVFKTGTRNGSDKPNVTVTLSKNGKNVLKPTTIYIEDTGGYDPKTQHVIEITGVPSGDLSLKFEFAITGGNYVGNLGYIALYSKTAYYSSYTQVPGDVFDLNSNLWTRGKTTNECPHEPSYESGDKNIRYVHNGGCMYGYPFYVTEAGLYNLSMGICKFANGQFKLTISDYDTNAEELTQTFDVPKSSNYATQSFELTQNLTEGLKKMRLDFIAGDGVAPDASIFNFNNMKFEQRKVTVGSTGFATVGLPYATTLPEGVKGYAVTNVTATNVTLTEVATGTNIAANTGLIIVAKPGSYTFPVVESGEEIAGNQLVANTEGVKTATTEGEFYVLAETNAETKTVGLAQIAQGGTLAKNRAYMPATAIPPSGSAQPASFMLVFGDATMVTEVGESDAEAVETVVYNLAGQRVNANAKGLVVVKGRVYLKK